MPKSGDMEDQSNPVEYQAKGSGLAEAGMFEEGERALNDAVARVRQKHFLSEEWIPHLRTLKLRADALRTLKITPNTENIIKELVIHIITGQPPHGQGPSRIFYMMELQPSVTDIFEAALQTHYSPLIDEKRVPLTKEYKKELSGFLLIEPRILPLIRTVFEETTPNLIRDLVIGMLTDETTILTEHTTACNRFEAIFLIAKSDPTIKALVVSILQAHYSEFPPTNDDKQQLHHLFLLDKTMLPLIEETFGQDAIQEFVLQLSKSHISMIA